MEVEVTTVIDRPVAAVWRFYAVEHVQNHPRWDPDIELEQISDGPIRRGTVIKRRNTRYETPTEGIMEVVEFEPEQTMAVKIHDGPIETNGRVTFVPEGPDRTSVTIWAEFPGMDESMAEKITPLMERSAQTINRLVQSET